ncbi:putative CLASP domain-containing protein [Rosa chinensis]|uniref:Putative CLASP domain-containing protein n=1 Tax=Rosa chinensis TaxID=74649 RepID=A0A2P6SBE0_ROSCH|nr:putative CLASP domain-containing protein [Rosa chinensis]
MVLHIRLCSIRLACHLLCFLSKELLGDFEAYVEIFIPMLRNCKVAQVLPHMRIVQRMTVMQYFGQGAMADLYEDLIRCCVADAMSEVHSTARMCYRMFSKTWPECSRRLFSLFDSVIQRLINEEDGGIHRQHASPSVHDRGTPVSFTPQPSASANLPGFGTSATVAMGRSSSLSSRTSFSSGLHLSQAKLHGKGTERSLESVLYASKQKVSAIESMLRGLELFDRNNSSTLWSSSLDLGVDPPSSRDPPFPAAVPASNHLSNSLITD